MNQGSDARLVQVADVGGGLSRLLPQHEHLMVDEPEAVDDHLSLYRLDGVNHHPHSTRIQLLEALLGVDVLATRAPQDLREPLTLDSHAPS